jgi:hypothetical protein
MRKLLAIAAGLVVFAAACVSLVILGAIATMMARARPEPSPSPVVFPTPRPTPRPRPRPSPDVTRYLRHPGEERRFAREDAGRSLRLGYGFVDYVGKHHIVTCTIQKSDIEAEQAAYGYVEGELRAALNSRLQDLIDAEAARRGIAEHVRLKTEGRGGYRWEQSWPDEGVHRELQAFEEWLKAEMPARRDEIQQQLYRERGFLLRDGQLSIDHNAIARRATPHLDDCLQELLRDAEGYPTKQLVGLLLAFYQELKYEVPPEKVGPKHIMGLWVPAEVLAEGKGDCDSKAVAFAAMWRRLQPRVIVILVPQHALIGVEAKPGPDESYVQIGNRYFVLCEVAGPSKLRPGYQPLKGSFQYVTIDPA